jgi:hypothetical protein
MSVAAGVLAWMALTALAGLVTRATWPEYVAAAPTRSYSLLMLWGRLATGAVALLVASRLTAAIARTPSPAVFVGLVLLATRCRGTLGSGRNIRSGITWSTSPI